MYYSEYKKLLNKTSLVFLYSKSLMLKFPKLINNVQINNNGLIIIIKKEYINAFLFILKNHSLCQFKLLMDITAVDLFKGFERFLIIYQLLSIRFNFRLIIKTFLNKLDFITSSTVIFSSANWLEREIWDLFGIFFSNHLDLRRILTDYGFNGFPLRKDFPLTGFVEVVYNDELKRIVYKPLQLTQEFRFFDFQSPWYNIDK